MLQILPVPSQNPFSDHGNLFYLSGRENLQLAQKGLTTLQSFHRGYQTQSYLTHLLKFKTARTLFDVALQILPITLRNMT